jgi:hypothetical protein
MHECLYLSRHFEAIGGRGKASHNLPMVKAGNTHGRGRLSTVDLLIKVPCFVRKM